MEANPDKTDVMNTRLERQNLRVTGVHMTEINNIQQQAAQVPLYLAIVGWVVSTLVGAAITTTYQLISWRVQKKTERLWSQDAERKKYRTLLYGVTVDAVQLFERVIRYCSQGVGGEISRSRLFPLLINADVFQELSELGAPRAVLRAHHQLHGVIQQANLQVDTAHRHLEQVVGRFDHMNTRDGIVAVRMVSNEDAAHEQEAANSFRAILAFVEGEYVSLEASIRNLIDATQQEVGTEKGADIREMKAVFEKACRRYAKIFSPTPSTEAVPVTFAQE